MSELAGRAITSLAAVQSMGENLSNDHPMRYPVRSMKRIAERTLADAFCVSWELAMQADQLVKDFDKAIENGGSE